MGPTGFHLAIHRGEHWESFIGEVRRRASQGHAGEAVAADTRAHLEFAEDKNVCPLRAMSFRQAAVLEHLQTQGGDAAGALE